MSNGTVMLISGTSRGVGYHLAKYYASQGWIVAGCSRGKCDLEHPNYHHSTVDITDEAETVTWVRGASKEFGHIDAVLNNAGLASMNHALLTPVETVESLFDTNFRGTFVICREAAKVMQRRKFGRIVNFGSIAVSMVLEGESIYAATKAAVTTYSRILAHELAPWNITVNVVAPSPIKTDLIKGVPEGTMQKLLGRMAINRYGTFEDTSNVIDFFLSPNSSMITAQVITLGGR